MFLLRHPYLTLVRKTFIKTKLHRVTNAALCFQEQSAGHAKDLQKREKLVAKWTDEQTISKMKPHVTIEERLNQLKIKEAWD